MPKDIASVEREIKRLLRKWLPLLHLDHCKTDIKFISAEELFEMYKSDSYGGHVYDVTYERLHLFFDKELSWFADGFTTEQILLHELGHIKQTLVKVFVHRMIDMFVPQDQRAYLMSEYEDLDEKSTDDFARCFIRIYEKRPRKKAA